MIQVNHLQLICLIGIHSLDTKQQSLLFQIDYPEISDNIVPKHRFMSGFEQHVEAPDRRWQYLLFAAEPYETISFKVIIDFCISLSLFHCVSFRFLVEKSINLKGDSGHITIQKRNK